MRKIEARMMHGKSWVLVLGLGLAPLTLGGCEGIAYFIHLFVPASPTEKVEPDYADLPGSRVAVIVYASAKTQSEHRDVQLEVSSVVSFELTERIENLTTVSPRRILKYQREHLYWDEMNRTKLGKDLGAGHVLYISLEEFATVEPGSLQLYRGRVTASASLYETSLPAREARVWGPKDIRVTYPAEAATGNPDDSDSKIRYETIKILADRLAKYFYEHEVEAP